MDQTALNPRTATEAEIKELARANLPLARQVLFLRFVDRLQYHAVGILHDQAEASDVVQEVFIRAMREPRLFEEDFRTQAWLYRVTRNLCFNLARDRRRRGAILNTSSRTRGPLPSQSGQLGSPSSAGTDGTRCGASGHGGTCANSLAGPNPLTRANPGAAARLG